MAKVYKDVICPAVPAQPERIEQIEDGLICDLCGAKGFKGVHGISSWTPEYGVVDETTVSVLSGHSYPDGGNYVERTVDICSRCFKTKLQPWLEDQGAKFRRIEHDW